MQMTFDRQESSSLSSNQSTPGPHMSWTFTPLSWQVNLTVLERCFFVTNGCFYKLSCVYKRRTILLFGGTTGKEDSGVVILSWQTFFLSSWSGFVACFIFSSPMFCTRSCIPPLGMQWGMWWAGQDRVDLDQNPPGSKSLREFLSLVV